MSALLSWSASTSCIFILNTVFPCTLVASPINLILLFFSSWGTCTFIEWCTITAQTHSVTMATYCLSRCPLKMYSIYFSLPTYTVHIYSMHVCMYVKCGCIQQYHYQFKQSYSFRLAWYSSFWRPALPCTKYGLSFVFLFV